MVQNVDVNTPLELYSLTGWMDESINFMVLINFPIPCLLVYSRLQEFLVLGPIIDPLMLMPHSITPHV